MLLTVALSLTLATACDQNATAPATETLSGNVYTPEGIDATGVRDVTAELLAFFASMPDSSTIALPENARYRVEGTLLFEDRHGLTIDGNGATIFASEPTPFGHLANGEIDRRNRTRQLWLVRRSSSIRFKSLVLEGANPHAGTGKAAYVAALEAQHGIGIIGSKDILIEDVTITDVYGDFIYIGADRHAHEWSDAIVIRRNHFERNGRQGIAITAGKNILIDDNYIGETRRASIDLEPNNEWGGARHVTVQRNVFGPGRLKWIAAHGSAGTVEHIKITDNQLLAGRSMSVSVRAPEGRRRAHFYIRGNSTSQRASGDGLGLIRFVRVDTVDVSDNTSTFNPSRYMTAVYAERSCAVTVGDNTFPGAAFVSRIIAAMCPVPN